MGGWMVAGGEVVKAWDAVYKHGRTLYEAPGEVG